MGIGAIILPNQLCAENPLFSVASEFYLLEHAQFFLQHRYHKKKLLLQRASMKAYERRLLERGLRVHYVDFRQGARLMSLVDRLRNCRVGRLHMLDPIDDANVYGMSQYADGGRITTKPYISSSNYIRKMSDFGRGDWCDIWDGLFWRFISKHKRVFAANPRMRVMAAQVDRMGRRRLKAHVTAAERFLERLLG